MTELGNRLKEVRLAKGLSLDDLQSITKIQKRYLLGIEEGNYSCMPGNFYVRAFIKQYSEALNLNPDEIFETYKNEIPASINDDIPQHLSRVKTRKAITDGNSKIFDVLPKILIGVFVIGAASLLYYFLSNHAGNNANDTISKENEPVKYVKSENLEKAKETEKENENKKEESAKQEEKETPAPEAPKQELSVVQSSERNSTYTLKNADKFVVKLTPTGGSWVGIKDSKGTYLYQATLKQGAESQTVDLTAQSNAVIRVGNAAGIDIFINDQKLEYAIPPTQNVQNITIQYIPKTE